MTSVFKAAPLLAALVAVPAFSQPADPHARHDPDGWAAATPAKPGAKADDARGCPMMKGGQALGSQMKDGDGKPAPGQMAMGSARMMPADNMQQCKMMGQAKTAEAPAAKPGASEHDHQHQ